MACRHSQACRLPVRPAGPDRQPGVLPRHSFVPAAHRRGDRDRDERMRQHEVMRTRPVLVYDGDCAFCTASVNLARRRLRPRCEIVPWQSADMNSLRIDRKQAEYEVLWITPGGVVHGGAQAVARLLQNSAGFWAVPGILLILPPIRWLAHGVYRIIANNRDRMPGGTLECSLRTVHQKARDDADAPLDDEFTRSR